jgi:hypothetical protein
MRHRAEFRDGDTIWLHRATSFLILFFAVSLVPAFAQGRMVGLTSDPPALSFQLDSNPTSSQVLTITSTYRIALFVDTVSVCIGVPGGASWVMRGAASNSTTIPASAVQVSSNAGGSWVPIVGTPNNCGVTSVLVWQGNVSWNWWQNDSRTDSVSIRLNAYPANLEADTYTGTITVYAGFY